MDLFWNIEYRIVLVSISIMDVVERRPAGICQINVYAYVCCHLSRGITQQLHE